MLAKIQLRRDTAANWTSQNPVLAAGEIGINLDTLEFKVGDGTAAWSSLKYESVPAGGTTAQVLAKVSNANYDVAWVAASTGSGTVTTVSVASAAGVSGSVANPTTTPAITITLGNITPASVNATGLVLGSNLQGTNTGDQTISLTGDVTGSGTGSFAATIANNAVTNAKSAQMAAGTLKGNNTGSTANAIDLTATQATAVLNSFTSTLKGLAPASGGGTTAFLRADGSWAAPAGGGDVVGPSSSVDNQLALFSGTTGKLIKAATAITASRALASDASGIPVAVATTSAELAFVNGVTSAIQTQLNAKQSTGNYVTALTGDVAASGPGSAVATIQANAIIDSKVAAAAGIALTKLAALTNHNRALVSDASGFITEATTTATEIGYVNGVTSAIQTQLNGKQATGSYVTSLTGDVTAAGPGAAASTIAIGAVTDTKSSLAVKPAVTVVATTNQALTGTPTIDGQVTAAGSLILLTAQSTGSQNGPWVAAAGAWARPTWYPSGGTTQAFQFITTLVRLGTIYQGTTWRQTASGAITIDTTATTWAVVPFALNSSTLTGAIPVANTTANLLVSSAGITIDGGGSAITTGGKGFIQVNFNATITGWTILGDQTGSAVIDVKRSTYSGFPTTVSIVGAGNKPTLSSAQKNTAAPSSWTSTTITAGDILDFNVGSASTVTRVTLQLILART